MAKALSKLRARERNKLDFHSLAREYLEVNPGAVPVGADDVAKIVELFGEHNVRFDTLTPADNLIITQAALEQLEAYSKWGLRALHDYREHGNSDPLDRCMYGINDIVDNLFAAASRLPPGPKVRNRR